MAKWEDSPEIGRIREYARNNGYVTELCQMSEMPELWRKSYVGRNFQIKGIAGLTVHGGYKAIVAFMPDVPNDLIALALCHELGHIRTYAQVGHTGVEVIEDEAKAWSNALELAAVAGLSITPEMSQFALACLLSYQGKVTNETKRTFETALTEIDNSVKGDSLGQ